MSFFIEKKIKKINKLWFMLKIMMDIFVCVFMFYLFLIYLLGFFDLIKFILSFK